MRNIGPTTRRWLAEIEVYTLDDLRQVGAIAAYRFLKERYPRRVSLNLLWGLEAALRGMDWRELTDEEKEVLKQQLG